MVQLVVFAGCLVLATGLGSVPGRLLVRAVMPPLVLAVPLTVWLPPSADAPLTTAQHAAARLWWTALVGWSLGVLLGAGLERLRRAGLLGVRLAGPQRRLGRRRTTGR